MASFSEDDQVILNYFFTNFDKPIFLVRNMHPEVWALMQARYSRAKEGLRESFLMLLKEDPANYDLLLNALKNKDSEEAMKHAIGKAIAFMDKWVLGYGHSSVAEGAVVGIGLEGVSILSTKTIEDNRLCSYIEKSTRYVSFIRDSFYIDSQLENSKWGAEVKQYLDDLFKLYTDLHEPVLAYVKTQVPLAPGQSEPAWVRSCAARRFDAIRYILPACTKTSLGWTLNARNLAHALNKLSASPIKEFQDMAILLREEGKKQLPSLLKYSEASPYYENTDKEFYEYTKDYALPTQHESGVTLINADENIDEMLTTAILYHYSLLPFEELRVKVKQMTLEERFAVIDKYVEKMGQFDHPMREFEHVDFAFDVLMDYGSFRDLQRHRLFTQTNQLLTTYYGYDTPDDIIGAGKKAEFDALMQRADKLFREISKEMPLQAQYLIPLAYRKRTIFKGNLRQFFHFIRQRSESSVHASARKIIQQMYEVLQVKSPVAARYLKCTLDDSNLGRLKSEERLEEKIKKGMI